jgi:pimeloyl-ACP methyl ester carboxylesterase
VRAGLATIERGAGGRPLLLVHGFTGAAEDFAWHLDGFAAAGWHVVAPDLPGHGSSHPNGARFAFDAYASAVLAVADELGWDRFALLGHSMGGVIAQEIAAVAGHRLTALVLMDTSPDRIGVDAELVELACEVVTTGGMAELLAAQKAIGSPFESEAARRLRQEIAGWTEAQDAKLLRCSPEMYVSMARALTSAPSRAGALAAVRAPTLVVVGEHDALLREASERLAALVPGARLVVIPGAGHSPQVEAPEAWFDAVAGFLAGTGATTG